MAKGPSIIQLIEREKEKWENKPVDVDYTEQELNGVIKGLDLALEIYNNPYRFLHESERTAFARAEAEADRIIENRAGAVTPKAKPAGLPVPTLDQIRQSTADNNVVVRRKK